MPAVGTQHATVRPSLLHVTDHVPGSSDFLQGPRGTDFKKTCPSGRPCRTPRKPKLASAPNSDGKAEYFRVWGLGFGVWGLGCRTQLE